MFSTALSLTIEKSGKTIHLLKAGSKPFVGGKKRKKVELLGTLDQFKESKKKPVPSVALNDISKNIPPMFAPQGKKDAKDAQMKDK